MLYNNEVFFSCCEQRSAYISGQSKGKVKGFGFGSFVIMNIDGLKDRVLVAFLLSSVHDNPLRIDVGGHSLPITSQVVHLVTGLQWVVKTSLSLATII